jgi:hypothetical protein
VPPTSANLVSSLVPVVVDSQCANVFEDIHQQNAEVASSMFTAPFASGQATGLDGGDDDDSSSSYRQATDNGMEDNSSKSASVQSNYDDNASDAPLADYDVDRSWSDGHHSDLFETLFRTLPVDANKYHLPGTTVNDLSGPLLFPPCDYPAAISALLPHVDDGEFLLQELHNETFEQRTRLLYDNWKVLHNVNAVIDIKTWLESLSKEDHLLLIHLYAAYWVTTPVFTLSFGSTKAKFWEVPSNPYWCVR